MTRSSAYDANADSRVQSGPPRTHPFTSNATKAAGFKAPAPVSKQSLPRLAEVSGPSSPPPAVNQTKPLPPLSAPHVGVRTGREGTSSQPRTFHCLHRAFQGNKVHKVWQGDGILTVRFDGSVVLKDRDTGRLLGGTSSTEGGGATLKQPECLEEGQIVRIGGREVEIGTEVLDDPEGRLQSGQPLPRSRKCSQ